MDSIRAVGETADGGVLCVRVGGGDDGIILADPVRGMDGLETKDARDTGQMGADA
jgi:hypothetical protein